MNSVTLLPLQPERHLKRHVGMIIGRVGKGFLVVALSAAALLTAATPSSAASSVSGSDPVGDNADSFDARGDLVGISATNDGTIITLTARTRAFHAPTAWTPESVMYFDLDLSGGLDGFEWIALHAWGGVVETSPSFACASITPSWNAAASSYTVSFPASCLAGFSRADFSAYLYYTSPGAVSEDQTGVFTFHPPAPAGYWMAGTDGTVYAFGHLSHYGNSPSPDPTVDLEPAPDGRGYWVLDAAGVVREHGSAIWHGDAAIDWYGGERATSISSTPTGDGYWVFTNWGRVYDFGDATFYGDMDGVRLQGPVLDSVPTPSGLGYYMVAADGGIFAFGDAQFYGSVGGKRLNAPVMSLVPDPDGAGYWLVASDGGVFAFAAEFRGSMGSVRLNKPVTGMIAFGNGYLMVGEDGGIFNFSNAEFWGSLAANPPATPIVAVAAGK